MTTFTLQDLNTNNINNLPNTPEEDEAMRELFEKMGQDLTGGKSNVFHVPEPQTTPNLADIINNICTQLQLLSTVISQTQGNSQPSQAPSGENSLQECVSLTLQQADWFKEMVEDVVDKRDFDELVAEAVSERVESEVESYFQHHFSPEDHFDFTDAVENAVDDRLDDVVRDRVMDSLEEVVAEKLSEASIKVEF